ncbi:MAG: AMP-binding protein [Luteolibacter sp.]
MEPADVISPAFWNDPTPVDAGGGDVPCISGLENHVLFRTSGSSGAPKWIALSKQALLASANAVNRHLHVTPADCWGLALPLRHVGGFGVVARAHAAGCRFAHFTPRWDAAEFAKWLDANRVTLTSLVPTQVHDLVSAGWRAPSCLRAIVVGGGRLDETTGRTARDLGWPVLASYGMTEAASQIATQPLESLDDNYQPAPIPLLPLWRARLADDGRLEIAGPALFSGMVVKLGNQWRYVPREGEWHVTGDRVEVAGETLKPLGRADALVKVLGELVDPEEIERALMELSGGRLAPGCFVVVPVPDERAGHRLVPVFDAVVDRKLADGMVKLHNASVAGPWRLGEPLFLESFPRGALGKPLRAEIAAAVLHVRPL